MKNERPRPEAGGAVGTSRHDDPTASLPAHQEIKADAPSIAFAEAIAELSAILTGLRAALDRQADARPRIDPMALRLDEVADAVGLSRRAIERERSAGRFPRPDVVVGRVPLWKPETIRRWIGEGGR